MDVLAAPKGFVIMCEDKVRNERDASAPAVHVESAPITEIDVPSELPRVGEVAVAQRCVIVINTMKRRAGKTATFSISVDSETQRILKQEAKRSYDGNVSALVSAIAKEAKRQAALDWLLQRSSAPAMTDAEREVLLAEIDGRPAKKKRGRKAA
jgi:post-segregation antitoxin (ccd killing protein)